MTNGSPDAPATAPAHHLIEVKNPDAVQSTLSNGWNWLEDNAKLLAALVVVAILGSLGYAGVQYLERRQERASQEAYYAIESKFTKLKEGFERAKYQAIMPNMIPPDQAKEISKPATGDLAKDYGTLVADLEKIASEHAGTSGGAQAAILAAHTYLEYKQSDKAIELVKIPAGKMNAKQLLPNLAKVLWGTALASKGGCQEAVGIWQQVIDNQSVAFLQADTSLRAGLCFEQMNQADRALEMYRKATAQGESAAGQTAKGLLRALEMKTAQAAKQG